MEAGNPSHGQSQEFFSHGQGGTEIGNGIREAYLEARRLKPGAVFAFGHEPLERRILGQIQRRVGETPEFHCAGNPGDSFFWSGGRIK